MRVTNRDAVTVADELARLAHPAFREHVVETIEGIDINGFYTQLPKNLMHHSEIDEFRELSVTAVYDNGYALPFRYEGWKKARENLMALIGIYDRGSLTDSIRSDRNILKIMQSSESPISMLCEYSLYEDLTGDMKHTYMPILVVPGADREHIDQWQDKYSSETIDRRVSVMRFA